MFLFDVLEGRVLAGYAETHACILEEFVEVVGYLFTSVVVTLDGVR